MHGLFLKYQGYKRAAQGCCSGSLTITRKRMNKALCYYLSHGLSCVSVLLLYVDKSKRILEFTYLVVNIGVVDKDYLPIRECKIIERDLYTMLTDVGNKSKKGIDYPSREISSDSEQRDESDFSEYEYQMSEQDYIECKPQLRLNDTKAMKVQKYHSARK